MWVKDGSDPKFKVKYKILHHSKIFNFVGPPSGGWKLSHNDMMIRAEKRVSDYNARNRFFQKLVDSVEKEGFRNPIIVRAGYMPMPYWKNLTIEYRSPGMENMAFCDQLGGSRLWVAYKLNISIPCIIRDYVDMFDGKTYTTANEMWSIFTDKPEDIILNENKFSISWKTVKI